MNALDFIEDLSHLLGIDFVTINDELELLILHIIDQDVKFDDVIL